MRDIFRPLSAKEESTFTREPTSFFTVNTTVALQGAAKGSASRLRMKNRVVLQELV